MDIRRMKIINIKTMITVALKCSRATCQRFRHRSTTHAKIHMRGMIVNTMMQAVIITINIKIRRQQLQQQHA